jgi:hypothetical protein
VIPFHPPSYPLCLNLTVLLNLISLSPLPHPPITPLISSFYYPTSLSFTLSHSLSSTPTPPLPLPPSPSPPFPPRTKFHLSINLPTLLPSYSTALNLPSSTPATSPPSIIDSKSTSPIFIPVKSEYLLSIITEERRWDVDPPLNRYFSAVWKSPDWDIDCLNLWIFDREVDRRDWM